MPTLQVYHWQRLDGIAAETGVDIRTILWSIPFLPPEVLPYMPPDGVVLDYPAQSLTPLFSPLPNDLAALKSRLDG